LTPGAALSGELLRFAPLLLTIVGWWLVNRQSNKRETRKEHRALVDAAKREIVKIADDAASYFMDTMSPLSPKIKWSLDVLEIELERLPDAGAEHFMLFEALACFAEACTGGEFEQKNRARLDHTSAEIREIYLTRNRLLSVVDRHFDRVYAGRTSQPARARMQ
jgi:hypothetical protein